MRRKKLPVLIALCLGAGMMIYPLLWLVGATFRTNTEIFSSAGILPLHPVLDGWKTALQAYGGQINLLRALCNTYQFAIPKVLLSSDGISVICDQEWLTGSINGTKLILQTEKNKTGGIRSTTVVLRGMNNSVNIKVIQGDISEILGEYELSGSSITTVNARGNGYLHPATIKAVLQNDDLGIGYELSLPEYDYVIPLRNNDKNSFLLILNGGKHVGTVKVRNTEYALFTAFSDKSGSSVTFSMETAMDILFDNVNNTVVGSFMDIGSWRGNKADALCLYAALPSSITSILDATSYNGWWLRVESPFLKKKE